MIDRDAKFFVYFAEMGDGVVKVGTSANVRRRMAQLKARLLHTIEGGSFRECAVHFLLRASNLKGEFFHQTEEVVSFVETLRCGDFQGLIDDLPWRLAPHNYANGGPLASRTMKCFKRARISLGLSSEQVAEEAGVAISTAMSADGLTAPSLLTGRMTQYIVGKAAERGVFLNSHHFTGMHDDDLRDRLSDLREVAA